MKKAFSGGERGKRQSALSSFWLENCFQTSLLTDFIALEESYKLLAYSTFWSCLITSLHPIISYRLHSIDRMDHRKRRFPLIQLELKTQKNS
uniref:Uncharacterized protein n=1 Tax=Gossypium raimondii TaxID=29730 RepID=A0A0D2QRA8_GOSRA|nr:hypothetical protein B456_001G163200 [Gossypium raimondii]